MRKYSGILIVTLISLILMSCASVNERKQAAIKEKKPELSLHTLAKHDDIELDEYQTELYEGIKHRIHEQPEMGAPEEFTLKSYRLFENYQGRNYVFLGVNRLNKPIKNISFHLTVGDEQGNKIWDKQTVFLSVEDTGIIPANSVVPILLPVTHELLTRSKKVDFDSLNIEMTAFYFEDAD